MAVLPDVDERIIAQSFQVLCFGNALDFLHEQIDVVLRLPFVTCQNS